MLLAHPQGTDSDVGSPQSDRHGLWDFARHWTRRRPSARGAGLPRIVVASRSEPARGEREADDAPLRRRGRQKPAHVGRRKGYAMGLRRRHRQRGRNQSEGPRLPKARASSMRCGAQCHGSAAPHQSHSPSSGRLRPRAGHQSGIAVREARGQQCRLRDDQICRGRTHPRRSPRRARRAIGPP